MLASFRNGRAVEPALTHFDTWPGTQSPLQGTNNRPVKVFQQRFLQGLKAVESPESGETNKPGAWPVKKVTLTWFE